MYSAFIIVLSDAQRERDVPSAEELRELPRRFSRYPAEPRVRPGVRPVEDDDAVAAVEDYVPGRRRRLRVAAREPPPDIADLLEAERLLEDEGEHTDETYFMTNRKIHFNLHAVRATLARVYLTMGNKDSAYYYADKVIQESGCRLTEATEVNHDVAGVLSNNETIFGIYYAGFYSVVNPKLQQEVSFSSLDPRKDILSFYTEGGEDVRHEAYFTTENKLRLSKLTDIYELNGIASSRPADRVLGINLIRLPEMYYIAAEALLDSIPDRALALFDEVLTHRGLNPYETWPSQATFSQQAINNERYREFIGEGQTFYNLKRQNLPINGVDGQTMYAPSSAIYTVPIPDIEYSNRY